MAVYEIKKPTPVPVQHPPPIRKDLAPVERVEMVTPVDKLLKRWRRPKERQGEGRRKAPLSQEARNDVRALIARTNDGLQRQSVPIRLVLAEDGDGFVIDVYECHDHDACRIVGDIVIDLTELPLLLRNLDRESGILLDTVS